MPVLSFVDRSLIEPGCSALTNFTMSAVVGLLPDEREMALAKLKLEKPPTESFEDIGGLEQEIEEIRESVELPLTRPDLYEEMGISAPKGILLYGPPGTGKTLLAKAVANRTSATFIRMSGSELVEKHSGEGPKKVRDMFRLAREMAPSIIFIDEVDAIGTKRTDGASEGELEVQRTMLELLTQLDGFDERGNVKVIMATNRIDTLDPALIRPGRIDRKVEIPLPGVEVLSQIFQIHTRRMSLSDDVVAEHYLSECDGLSGADVGAMCAEAGLIALRDRRRMVTANDFALSKINVIYRKKDGTPRGMYI